MKEIESVREFGGWLKRYTHASETCQCEMTFSIYLPPQAETAKVPAVYFLSGLTCTDDNFRTKAGAQRYAAELGLALVIPDTSPRGENVPDEPDRYDLGQGAGFYVNATEEPWSKNYHMYDYVVSELPALVEANFPLQPGNHSVTGHSMGGHGALIVALKNPGKYKSVSAFAPISNPSQCAWGEGCFGTYLGSNKEEWKNWDATCLVDAGKGANLPIMVDQGGDDEFLEEYLMPEKLVEACQRQGLALEHSMQPGYDHSYHFISTFIGSHLAFHASHLV